MFNSNKSCNVALRNFFFVTKIAKNIDSTIKTFKRLEMEFTEYIKSLPNQRNEVIISLTKLCRVNESTVYRWLRGDFVPDALKRKVISDYLNIPEKELWPNV